LGGNNEVNPETKKAALKLMEGGPSKINPPDSHPSNPVHKAATAGKKKKKISFDRNSTSKANCAKNRAYDFR